jgi:hypothetical protein
MFDRFGVSFEDGQPDDFVMGSRGTNFGSRDEASLQNKTFRFHLHSSKIFISNAFDWFRTR